jgi:formylglycine-generating enzyme required for sulfatase activity
MTVKMAGLKGGKRIFLAVAAAVAGFCACTEVPEYPAGCGGVYYFVGGCVGNSGEYEVTVSSAAADASGGGKYAPGAVVPISAGTVAGQEFKSWTVTNGGVILDNSNNSTTTFTMPAHAVTVTATFASVVTPSGNVTERVNEYTFEMVSVAGGTFSMGCTSEQSDCDSDESPSHQVTLSNYYIGKHEVTQGLWKAVMNSNPSYFTGNDNLPVENVSWTQCTTFVRTLNGLVSRSDGMKYRLPTEAEWEYASRGGSNSNGYKYSGSDAIGNVAWYWDNSSSGTKPVGTKSASELGIDDMSGNVWEWVSDWYNSSYYNSFPQANPTGPLTGSDRVYRGGSWDIGARNCRVSIRGYYYPGGSGGDIGFRLVLSP